jgi:hypothetical protein
MKRWALALLFALLGSLEWGCALHCTPHAVYDYCLTPSGECHGYECPE